MSRITKEEIEKTKCGRFLLSDENIYLSIYSLNSYVFEYNLLNTEDRILYHRLQDKFDARLINGVITRVREQIIELFDKDKYIEAKVYFKPKKLSENGELEFRPLHSTGLITQIAIVSMLHLFVYEIPEEEEGDPKLRLSNLSRLIPSDFYGNRVSVKGLNERYDRMAARVRDIANPGCIEKETKFYFLKEELLRIYCNAVIEKCYFCLITLRLSRPTTLAISLECVVISPCNFLSI